MDEKDTKRIKDKEEVAPILGNPGFDTSYDTFQQDPPSIGAESVQNEQAEPHSNDQIGIDLDETFNDEIEDIPETGAIDPLEESLPSSQLRRIKTVAKPGQVRQRRKSKPGVHDVSVVMETSQDAVQDGGELVTQLEGLDAEDAGRFKETTLPLHAKKSFRRSLHQKKAKKVGRWKQFKFSLSIKFDRFRNNFVDFFKNMDIWRSNLKNVDGKFGSGVLSYFSFLRWLFLLDIVITIMVIAFISVPQFMFSPSYKTNTVSFTGKELLTGEGWFENTEMYIGYYSNSTIKPSKNVPYNLPLAYLAVGGGYVLLCVIVLVRSMGLSYKENYISGSGFSNSFFAKVFCTWNYAVTQQSSASLHSKSIYNDLMESLSETRKKRDRAFSELCKLFWLRFVTNLLVFGMMAAVCYLIYFVSNTAVKQIKTDELILSMLPAVTISALNLLLPFIFRIIASMERYQTPKTTLEVSLFRTILLKLASLCVYIVVLNAEVKCIRDPPSAAKCKKVECWETWVGEQIYKLTVVDFIFLMLVTFFGEHVRRILAVYIPSCDKKIGIPGFDISRNVLDLIYAQGLCWVGTFFCPMLPLITVIKFFILFYFKKDSVLRNCRPSMRPFKAAKMRLLFLFLLGLMLLMAVLVIGYIIMNDDSLKPSANCGPFRGKVTIYQMIKDVIKNDLAKSFKGIVDTITSIAVIIVTFFVLALMAYYFRLRKSSAEKKIKLLKEQITIAGQDKLYLLNNIRKILKKRSEAANVVS